MFKKVLIALCGVLGLTGCPVAYGTPHADYRIMGHVSDENGKPVTGIQVRCIYGGKVETLASGDYDMNFIGLIQDDAMIVFDDIDGDKNGGEFERAILPLSETEFVQTRKGDKRWYYGAFEARHKDITLSLKKEDAENTQEQQD